MKQQQHPFNSGLWSGTGSGGATALRASLFLTWAPGRWWQGIFAEKTRRIHPTELFRTLGTSSCAVPTYRACAAWQHPLPASLLLLQCRATSGKKPRCRCSVPRHGPITIHPSIQAPEGPMPCVAPLMSDVSNEWHAAQLHWPSPPHFSLLFCSFVSDTMGHNLVFQTLYLWDISKSRAPGPQVQAKV